MAVRPVPQGYHTVTPSLTVDRARDLLKFLQKVFGAKVVSKMDGPGGALAHSEVQVGDSLLMIADPMGPHGAQPASLYVYVPDSDKTYRKAIAAGATEVMPLDDQFWGDRGGCVKDDFGNSWWISTRKENLSPRELGKRAEAAFASKAGGAGAETTSMKKPSKKSDSKSKLVAKGGASGKVRKTIEPPSVAARRRSAPIESAVPTAARVIQSEAKTMENPGHMGAGGTAPPAPPPVWREDVRPEGVPEAAPLTPPVPRRRR